MTKTSLTLLVAALLAGCGGEPEAGALTADEQERLENIAARLDEDNKAVRETLEAEANQAEAVTNQSDGQ